MSRGKGVKNVNPSSKWTTEEIEWLRVNYPLYDINQLLPLFNEHFNTERTRSSLQYAFKKYKILCGRSGQWQKGHIPSNKGKTWDEYMSKEGQANSRKTQFNSSRTVNNANHNEYPIGAEREIKDGYIVVKIDNRSGIPSRKWWKFKHHIIWEAVHGPVPKDHKIIFADGNIRNFDINNLVLVSQAELAIMNKNGLYYKENADATKCGVSLAKLMIRRKQYAKKQVNRSK